MRTPSLDNLLRQDQPQAPRLAATPYRAEPVRRLSYRDPTGDLAAARVDRQRRTAARGVR